MTSAHPKMERALSALPRGEEWVRSILESTHEAFISMDHEGFITEWNPQAEQTFGWPREEAIGRVLANTVLPSQLRKLHWRLLDEFLVTGDAPFLGKRLEVQALHRDGHEFPVEITISAIRSREGFTLYAFLHDISDRRRAEKQLSVARELALDIANAETLEGALVLALQKIGSWGGWKLGEAWVRTHDGTALEHTGVLFAASPDLEHFERATKGKRLTLWEPKRKFGI